MNNISHAFREAKIQSATWASSTHDVIRAIAAERPDLGMDWDEGAGEDWARICQGENILVMLRENVPLAFLSPNQLGLAAVLQAHGVVTVSMRDWAAEEFCLDSDIKEEVFPDWVWRDTNPEAFRRERFSVWDLWWATV